MKRCEPRAGHDESFGNIGVADVRAVRERISACYHGDLRKHAAETDRIVEPLIAKLGLKLGVAPHRDTHLSGTEE